MTRQDTAETLYEHDFYGWTQQQAELLREGRLDRADVANILEEIETLGRSELSSLRSAYRLVALHLLKMRFQPSHRTESWHATIVRERNVIEAMLEENPGMRPKRAETFLKAYRAARREAAAETGLPLKSFPSDPPFALDEVEDHDAWP